MTQARRIRLLPTHEGAVNRAGKQARKQAGTYVCCVCVSACVDLRGCRCTLMAGRVFSILGKRSLHSRALTSLTRRERERR